MKLTEYIKDYFRPTKRLQTSYVLFVVLVVIYEIFLSFNPQYFGIDKPIDATQFKKEIAEFRKGLVPKDKDFYESKEQTNLASKYENIKLFNFNPNTTNQEELQALGLSEKQAKTILNYRNKGGKFRTKKDFSKMYSISETQFNILKPYINLPESKQYSQYDKYNKYDKTEKEPQIIELFEFDPNLTSHTDYKRLGLTDRQINTIDKYLSKGGKFRKKSDFKKMYVISEKQYEMLYPYIKIEIIIEEAQAKPELKNFKTENHFAELNSATVEELIKVRGIGKYSAQKIVEYRKKLGGYVKIEQLREVKGVYEESYLKAKEYLTINTENIKKININYADFKKLIQHPYLEKVDVVKILNYRRKKRKYTNINQLLEKKILEKTLFLMLKPYFKI